MTCEPYTFAEHQHRLAAWAAGRAAFTRVDGGTVVRGRKYLEACSVTTKFGAEDLGNNREEFDEKHRKWREIILLEATRDGVKLAHGHAAKLLNVYFKIRFVCGPRSWQYTHQFHPSSD